MKKFSVILITLALTGHAIASGLVDAENPYTFSADGNLTAMNPDVWGTWGGDNGSNGSVVVSNGVCTFTSNSYEIAFSHDNALADIGNPVPGVDNVEIHFDVISLSGGNAIVKIECHPLSNSFPNPDNGQGSVRIDAWDPDTTITGPGHYSFSTADKGGPIHIDTAAVTPVVGVGNGTAETPVVMVIDNFWVGKAGTYSTTKAINPVPADGAIASSVLTTALSWRNPDPNNPADTITCDVYFLDAGTAMPAGDPNMGPSVLDPGVIQIADDLEGETISFNDALTPVGPLQDGHYYFWAVHCTDTNGGSPVTTQGDTWYFVAGDAPPVVSAGPDEYAWIAKEDGDGNPLEYTITVTGTYIDDGKSPITSAGFVNLGWDIDLEQDGLLKVSEIWDQTPGTVHTSGTVTAVYKTVDGTTAIPGYWDLQLQVTDGAGTGQDTALVRVDVDCGTATENDPRDSWNGYYDVNNDCVVDLSDFLDFVDKWMDQSVKYE